MLKTLLKTWATLAPEEVQLTEWDQLWLNSRYGLNHIDLLSDGSLLPWDQDLIQGHLQRCIKARGWSWSLGLEATPKEEFHEAIVRISGNIRSLVFDKSAVWKPRRKTWMK